MQNNIVKKLRRTKEEVFLDKLAKKENLEAKIALRQEKQAKKLAAQELKKKPEPTEEELVKKYVNKVIRNQQYHGRVDTDKFSGLEYKAASKNLFLDTDFYFSVVFQSRAQRFEFLEKWEKIHESLVGAPLEDIQSFKIINGLKLAEALGIELTKETTNDYPTAQIDLLPFVLDSEKI